MSKSKNTKPAAKTPPRRNKIKVRFIFLSLLLVVLVLGILNNKSLLSLSSGKGANRTVVLDPGHGGSDGGAIHTDRQGKIDLLEKDINLQIALKTGRLLQADGYKVVYTRQTDSQVNQPATDLNEDGLINEQDDLAARIEIANQQQADIFISIHVNSSRVANETGGIETWYCADRPFGSQSRLLAELIQKESLDSLTNVASGYPIQNRGILDDITVSSGARLHIATLGPTTPTRKVATAMPGVLTEILFLNNDKEAALLAQDIVLEQLAAGYSKAINDYFATRPL